MNTATDFGSCSKSRREIKISVPYVLLNNKSQIKDTILHEIAHAITDGVLHDYRWRITACKIGARPSACAHGALYPTKRKVKNGVIDYKQARELLDGEFITTDDFNKIMNKRYL